MYRYLLANKRERISTKQKNQGKCKIVWKICLRHKKSARKGKALLIHSESVHLLHPERRNSFLIR